MVEFGWTPYIAAAQPPGTFTVTGSMLTGRAWHTATLLSNGKVLIAGGFSQVGLTIEGLSSAELYDPATGSFSATGSMSVPRVSHTATLLPDGRVLIAGGYAGFTNQEAAGATSSAELYDSVTGTFTATGQMSVPRFMHTATLHRSHCYEVTCDLGDFARSTFGYEESNCYVLAEIPDCYRHDR